VPTVALHSHYWQNQPIPPEITPGASGSGGYPNWQMNIVRGLLIWLLLY
jgi:hypothetical protein